MYEILFTTLIYSPYNKTKKLPFQAASGTCLLLITV
jgi:hypothetical protein